MKSIIYIAFFALFSLGLSAQEINQQELAESSKITSTKISQELNLDDDQSMFLHRAIYSTGLSRQRAEQQFGEQPEKLEATNEKIEQSFHQMLSDRFSETQVANIIQLVKKKDE